MKNLINKVEDAPKDSKLLIFDLDGTLTETKSKIDQEMAGLLKELLDKKSVAVIGGGKYEIFMNQFIGELNIPDGLLEKLYLFPASGTVFYKYQGGIWDRVYAHEFSPAQKNKIFDAFDKTFKELGYKQPEKIYGEVIEDRGTQITFSALGQDVVEELGKKGVELKEKWRDENKELKMKMAETLQKFLPEFEVRAAGHTSIDITKKGIDKEYGVRQIQKELNMSFDDMLFVGDALFPGGNDSAALRTGVLCFEVEGIGDTKKLLKYILEK